MLRINYHYTTNVDITFDDLFKYEHKGTLDSVVNFIEWAFSEYYFTKAEAVDADTGEVLLTVYDELEGDSYDVCDGDVPLCERLAYTE